MLTLIVLLLLAVAVLVIAAPGWRSAPSLAAAILAITSLLLVVWQMISGRL